MEYFCHTFPLGKSSGRGSRTNSSQNDLKRFSYENEAILVSLRVWNSERFSEIYSKLFSDITAHWDGVYHEMMFSF